MTIQRLRVGKRMSGTVINGRNVHMSGMTAKNHVGRTTAEQTTDILARIEELLVEAGTDKQHMVQVNIWLADISDFDEMNSVWDEWVPEGAAPVRATVEARLALPDIKVEIQVLATLPDA